MSRFLSAKYNNLEPYTPGEQPKDIKYIKLNTNESPFPPSQKAVEAASEAAGTLQLYPDPECTALNRRLAEVYGLEPEQILVTNGSDEILNFAFMAFCDELHGVAYPEISYGFYQVFAAVNNIPALEIPLRDDFSVDISQYFGLGRTIVIANPNAPTGLALSREEIERILINNPDNIVVIDEAYVDFGAESCVPLINKYDNLLVTMTYSKSRSMAGARVGFGMGSREIIADLNTIKYSTNPYNINRMTMAAAIGALEDEEYTRRNCEEIIKNREYTARELKELGFEVLPSKTNFLFARHNRLDGGQLYLNLKKNGILIRHFSKPALEQYNRITIGTREQMDAFLEAVKRELEAAK